MNSDSLPVKEAPYDVIDRNCTRVVIRLIALKFFVIMPRWTSLVGVSDQNVVVEPFKSFFGHCCLPFRLLVV
jgi:hypothetical protein